jgi:hypothetical protein
MCDNAQDSTYSAFGGKWQRDNPSSGRVASLFDPAGGQVMEQGLPTEAEPTPQTAEEAGESAEPLAEEPEAATEAAEPPMKEPKEEAAEAVPPEESDGKEAESGLQAETDKNPVGGTLELPVMPEESAESPKPDGNDAGLLPPLEPPP